MAGVVPGHTRLTEKESALAQGTESRGARFPFMRTSAGIAILLLTTAAVHAQAPPSAPPAPPAQQATVRCAPIQLPNSGQGSAPSPQTTGQSREPLSDRLAQSDGVLCPPSNIDPQMHKDAPNEGKMPVITPPGGPGGDPTIRPK